MLLVLFYPLLAATIQPMYAYGVFIVAVAILELRGALVHKRGPKLAGLAVYLFGVSLFIGGMTVSSFARPLFSSAMLVILYLALGNREQPAPASGKPRLSLYEQGLSPAESAYVRAAATGTSYKEIASNAKVSESTVRNTLARAYRKLGVADKAALVALVDAHELTD